MEEKRNYLTISPAEANEMAEKLGGIPEYGEYLQKVNNFFFENSRKIKEKIFFSKLKEISLRNCAEI